ncbi:hypothetical protein QCA50_010091 [Cerrena zonata]|uniref:Ubiquitin domain-containing protein DSK2 n=1 Tax=Cerrena zonata TaxID=2478898 RepID=A0AAW0G951_9APHY
MSDSEIQINIKGPSELKLQITITPDKTVLDLKEAIAEKSDVPADRQRLIYSGRVLKDEDILSVYKIQSSHTIHMVKGAARNNASSSSTPQTLPTMQAGQNPHDPLTQLNSHQGYGLMAGLNPFAEMGVNPNDPNMLQGMMNNPQFLQQMSQMMSNPAIMDGIIASNPQLAGMGQVFQSERFREMISNPEMLRMMLNMSNVMQGGGGGFGAPSNFPAPGLPSTAQQPQSQTPAGTTPSNSAAGGTAPQFPFNPLFGIGAPGAGAGAGNAPPNPFGDPAAMQQMMNLLGGGGSGGGLGGGLGGFGSTPAAPADSRPPEERFQVQLQQLQDMGFTNASQNIRALLATGGNVHSAIEYILTGGGL